MKSLHDHSIHLWVKAQQRIQDLKDLKAEHDERGASELATTLIMAGGFIAISLLVVGVFRSRTNDGLDCLDMTGSIPEGCTSGTEAITDG